MIQAHENPNIIDGEVEPLNYAGVPTVPVKVMTGTERAVMSTDLVNALHQEFSGVQAYVLLKNAEDVLKQSIEIAKERACATAEKDTRVFDAEVTTRRSVEYEYEDSVLDKLEDQIKELKKQADERRKLLRTIKSEQADTATGEIMKPARCVKDGISIVVKLPQ
jgi:hypothetical protein